MDDILQNKIHAYFSKNGPNPVEDAKKTYSKIKVLDDKFGFIHAIETIIRNIADPLVKSYARAQGELKRAQEKNDSDEIFSTEKKLASENEALTSFKQKLQEFQDSFIPKEKRGVIDWKNSLLNLEKLQYDAIDTSNTESTFNASDPGALSLNNSRIRSVSPKLSPSLDSHVQEDALQEALTINIGSTYVLTDTYRKSVSSSNESHKYLCMDAAHYGRMPLGNGRYAIFTAVADGAGGHTDEYEDIEIAKTSDRAAKFAVSYMASAVMLSTGDPNKIKSHMQNLRRAVAQELRTNADSRFPGANTTLAFSTVIVEKDGSQRVIGGNVGDSLIASYNPQTKEWKTLSAAKQDFLKESNKVSPDTISNAGFAQDGSYAIRENQEIFEETLPKGTLLLPMTDGVYDGLSCTIMYTTDKKTGKAFKSTSLNTAEMPKMEENNPTAKDMQNLIRKTVEENTNKKKQDSTEKSVGDDYTLLVVDSSKVSEIFISKHISEDFFIETERRYNIPLILLCIIGVGITLGLIALAFSPGLMLPLLASISPALPLAVESSAIAASLPMMYGVGAAIVGLTTFTLGVNSISTHTPSPHMNTAPSNQGPKDQKGVIPDSNSVHTTQNIENVVTPPPLQTITSTPTKDPNPTKNFANKESKPGESFSEDENIKNKKNNLSEMSL